MWNLRSKTNEQRGKKSERERQRERERGKPRKRLLTTENKLMVTRGKVSCRDV